MNYRLRIAATLVALLSLTTLPAGAAEVVYRIVGYNKDIQDFTIEAAGMIPEGSAAYFVNDYGATTGNRFNQIPRNREATLYLEGWQGCTIKSVTLGMCSNIRSGQAGLTVTDGEATIYTERASDFGGEAWFGQWVSKDLGVYVDINRPMSLQALTTDLCGITLKGGTSEGSVYLSTITIDYDAPEGIVLESPLGWRYEKLTKQSTLSVGDKVMIYRSGCAAADIDGMATSHYLDALPMASTADVTSRDVLCFSLDKAEEGARWTLTDQHGRMLGASATKTLAWDEGVTAWDIQLGYDGATITPANTSYGTLRYNAPAESYARFALYTSTSLTLPYLYRRLQQLQPVEARTLTLDAEALTISLEEGQLALHPTLLPSTTTDKRILWQSSNEEVATVNGGFVSLLAPGETTISATSHDGQASASVILTVTAPSAITSPQALTTRTRKVVSGHQVVILKDGRRYNTQGMISE